jgi:hypothetical protein
MDTAMCLGAWLACCTALSVLPAISLNDIDSDDSDNDYEIIPQAVLDQNLLELSLGAGKAEGREERLADMKDYLLLGANPRRCMNDYTQSTAIEHAFVQRDFAMLELFFDPQFGDTVNMVSRGRTLLARAQEDHDTEMIQFLFAHGARPIEYQFPKETPSRTKRFCNSWVMRLLRLQKSDRYEKMTD